MNCYPKPEVYCDECVHNDFCTIYQDYKKLVVKIESLEAELREDYKHPEETIMEIKDETELKAIVVINQRAYEVPKEVAEYIEQLRKDRDFVAQQVSYKE